MKLKKYWRVRSELLNDEDFDALVYSLEKYIKTRNDKGKLPQKNCEMWLEQFIEGYSNWSCKNNKFCLVHPNQYFQIDTRMASEAIQ